VKKDCSSIVYDDKDVSASIPLTDLAVGSAKSGRVGAGAVVSAADNRTCPSVLTRIAGAG
jgi:hypothetical protein